MGDHKRYHLSPQYSIDDDSHYTKKEDVDLETNEDVDELVISLVQRYPHLYNTELDDFKDAAKKENSWREIAAIIQMDVDACQTRWRRLRERYSREKKKQESETTAEGGVSKRKPFVYFENMQFLERFVKRRRSANNIKSVVCRPSSSRILYFSDDSYYTEEEEADLEAEGDADELLISLVQGYPHLYNKDHENFKDAAEKEISWQEIATIIQMDADVCQTRWRRLREQYSREKKKRESEPTSGSKASKRRPFMYFDNMQYLEPFVKRRRTMTTRRLLASRPSLSENVSSRKIFKLLPGPALDPGVSDDVSFCQYVLTTITMMPESEKAKMKKKILRTLLNL